MVRRVSLSAIYSAGCHSLKNWSRFTPSKAAFRETALFEVLAGTAGAEIVSGELFLQQLIAVDNPFSTSITRIISNDRAIAVSFLTVNLLRRRLSR